MLRLATGSEVIEKLPFVEVDEEQRPGDISQGLPSLGQEGLKWGGRLGLRIRRLVLGGPGTTSRLQKWNWNQLCGFKVELARL